MYMVAEPQHLEAKQMSLNCGNTCFAGALQMAVVSDYVFQLVERHFQVQKLAQYLSDVFCEMLHYGYGCCSSHVDFLTQPSHPTNLGSILQSRTSSVMQAQIGTGSLRGIVVGWIPYSVRGV